MLRHGSLTAVLILSSLIILSGCASNNKKAELRDKVVQQTGFMCEFINGDQHKQVEIELNVMMAKRCDTEKPYSVTNYKTSAEVNGLLYCCRIKDQSPAKPAASPMSSSSSSTSTSTTSSTPATSPAVTAAPATNSKSTMGVADPKKGATTNSAVSSAKPSTTTNTSSTTSSAPSSTPKKPVDKASDVELDIEIEPGQ